MENNQMTVQEFVEKYNKECFDLREIVVNDYVGYTKKIALAEKLIEVASYAEDGHIHINTPFRYVLLIFTLVNNYTCVKMTNENMLEEFDLLNKNGLVDLICKAIPEREFMEFNQIIDACAKDFIANHYENHAFIAEQFDKLKAGIEVFSDAIMPKIEKALAEFKPEDIQKLMELLK